MDRPFQPSRARSWRAAFEIPRPWWSPMQQIKYLLTVGPSDGLRDREKRLFTAPVPWGIRNGASVTLLLPEKAPILQAGVNLQGWRPSSVPPPGPFSCRKKEQVRLYWFQLSNPSGIGSLSLHHRPNLCRRRWLRDVCAPACMRGSARHGPIFLRHARWGRTPRR
jgi:hypothetical protein